jgi:hypothetical protein
VFGSNLAGRHGKGAALHAKREHRAVHGVGVGRTGNAYAIPTKDAALRPLPLSGIMGYVLEFLRYAKAQPDLRFEVTRIGCGLAGYTDAQIAPMFADAPANCDLPQGWRLHARSMSKDLEAALDQPSAIAADLNGSTKEGKASG